MSTQDARGCALGLRPGMLRGTAHLHRAAQDGVFLHILRLQELWKRGAENTTSGAGSQRLEARPPGPSPDVAWNEHLQGSESDRNTVPGSSDFSAGSELLEDGCGHGA